MIRKGGDKIAIKTAEPFEIAKLIAIKNDNLEKSFSGSRGEIIQFFVNTIESGNTNIRILISIDGDKINAYTIAINNVIHPIASEIFIAHAYSIAGVEVTKALLENIINWGIEIGAVKITMLTEYPEHFENYGFKNKLISLMEKVING